MTSRKGPGFTLIELLVVISIVAALLMVMLPSLSSARESARITKCAGHLRQMGTAVFIYADANREWLPTGGRSHQTTWSPHGPNWSGVIANIYGMYYITEYTANADAFGPLQVLEQNTKTRHNGIMQCPSDFYSGYWNANLASTSYGWNDAGNGLGRNDAYVFSPAATTANGYRRIRRTEIRNPFRTVMIGDFVKGHGQTYEYQGGQLSVANLQLVVLHNDFVNILWADGRATRRNKFSINASELNRND